MKTIIQIFFSGIVLLICLSAQNLKAQSQITGTVSDTKGTAVAFANVLVLKAADSTLVKGAMTGNEGAFRFSNIEPGAYLIEVGLIGYEKYHSAVFKLDQSAEQKDLGKIVVRENARALNEVAIVAEKPLFEQKIDRLVVNVDNSITSAGATALEVLERSPGVMVNRQSNSISIAGKDGVVVMINGKINHMPLEAVVQMLAGMPSGNIEKFELITTPPANFDAEGNAGYINIVLKQTDDRGLNGSYNLSAGLGNGSIASAGLNFNYRKKSINLYGSYDFGRSAQGQVFAVDRVVELNGQSIGTNTESIRTPVQQNHGARIGFDYNLGPKTVVGMLLSGYDNRWSQTAVTRTNISLNGALDTLLLVNLDEINHWQHLGGNLNLQHTFREEEVLTFDADYLHYDNSNPANYFTDYSNASNQLLFKEQTFSGKLTPINIGVARLDYSKRFSPKLKMESGIKVTASQFDNDVTVAKEQNGVLVNDPSLTGQYHLEESIGAVYTSFDVKLDAKSDMKVGLRYEYSNSNLGSAEQANIVDRHYGNLFPSIFLSHVFNEYNSINLSYSRRITRPTFNDMAPFVFFLDPYTFFSGNAALQPAIANNMKLDYHFKTAFFSIQYTAEDSAISGFQVRVIPGTNKQLLAATNMKNLNTASFSVAVPLHITKWWSLQNNINAIWQEANIYYDQDLLHFQAANLQLWCANNFTLPANFSVEVSGFYNSRGLSGGGISLPSGGMNFGVQKKFGGDFGTIRFGVDDVFNSLNYRFSNNLPQQNIVSTGTIDWSSRTYKLSYSRNFGNKKLKGTRQRETGAEEERRRVH